MGKEASDVLGSTGMTPDIQNIVISAAVVAMMLVATLILLSEKELASKWGVRILDVGGLVEKTPEEEQREERVVTLVARAHLTPREAEYVCAGGSGEERPRHHAGPVHRRGHAQGPHDHIYEKCGVANRRELRTLLDG